MDTINQSSLNLETKQQAQRNPDDDSKIDDKILQALRELTISKTNASKQMKNTFKHPENHVNLVQTANKSYNAYIHRYDSVL
jgi:hypothetical protein